MQLLSVATFAAAAAVSTYAIVATVAPRLDDIVAALSGQPRSLSLGDSHCLTPELTRPASGQTIGRA